MKLRSISPATAIASLALLVSLSGTAVAAGLVTGATVVDGSLTGVDIHNNSLGTVDVRDHSLLPVDFKKLPAGGQGAAETARLGLGTDVGYQSWLLGGTRCDRFDFLRYFAR